MWKANLGETRRVLSTELNPAILLDHNDIEVGSAIARVRPGHTHTRTHTPANAVGEGWRGHDLQGHVPHHDARRDQDGGCV